jgi:molybdopterin-containing oxidoreductase family iron-sulfur binding subunit
MSSMNGAPAGRGKDYWRSLEHLADTPEFRAFMHREFPAGASELLGEDRRHFLKVMGASMALAGLGLAGCRRWPEEEIAPFAARPVGRVPGTPVHYATCMEMGGVATALLATSTDGRPTKLEGNPDHPASLGAASLLAQASILDLYDPDRSRTVRQGGADSSWADFAIWAADHFGKARGKRGAGLAVLSEASTAPSVLAMKSRFLAHFPNAKWYEYEPVNNDEEIAGSRAAFGMPYRMQADFGKAQIIVALDADIIGSHPNAVANTRGFAAGRRRVDDAGHAMNRLYAVESDLSLTGANADDRIAVRSADVAVIAGYLAARVTGDDALRRLESSPGAAEVLTPEVRATLDHAIADLHSHHGTSIVVAGAGQPAAVHVLAHLMNEALDNVGKTVGYTPQRDAIPHAESIRSLAGRDLETLVILGGNPVYDAPADVDFAALLGKTDTTIHLSSHVDETSQLCTWHVNASHFLEAWGDGRTWDGTFGLRQPLIEPLFGGRSSIELLATLIGDEVNTGRAIVERTFAEMVGGANETRWRQTLHDGLLSGSAFTVETPDVDGSAVTAAVDSLAAARSASDGWEIVFRPHPSVYDGRFANNGWCQEVPDPIGKLTWDNAVIISPRSAATLGVATGDMVRVTSGGRSVDAAILVQPGIADQSATLHLGYGRGDVGRIMDGAGFDFYTVRAADGMGFATGATIEAIGGTYALAMTQDHHTIDVETVGGRGVQSRLPSLFREADLEEYTHHEDFAAHRTHVVHRLSQWEESNLEGAQYAWAMSVDLNSCTGCGACIVACQAENNIPIVGKEQVIRGREMHWMRVDRYFRFGHAASDDGHGSAYDPNAVEAVALQPVLCMQCENAPCEQVCPVAATVHDKDGLNVMVYNRCVGTRYCSNNCPYKVRRFNYFDYHRKEPSREQPGALLQVDTGYFDRPQATPDELHRLQLNPEVSVRMRGVMEKCTYCIQRIAAGKIEAKNAYANLPEDEKARLKNQRVGVPDGSITPACAQTCPAQALVFGDLNDANSRVAKLHSHPRSYEMLEELHVKARTRYMAKVRNPADGGSSGGGHGGGEHDEHSAAPADRNGREARAHA